MSPNVLMPSDSRCSALRGPIPGMARTGRGARNAASSPGQTTVRPSGLSWSLAILATDLLAESPAEHVMPSSATRARMRRATATGCSVEKRPGVTSRKASSIETGCTRGLSSAKMARTAADISR